MLFRKAMSELLKWKKDPNKRALLITGARQIGKTYLVREFAKKNYENCVEINFIHNENAHKIFSGNLDAKTIYTQLTANIKQALKPGKTLIFLDEIQEVPRAIQSLKYFYEDAPEYYVCAAGSLLGLKLRGEFSYPVGKIDEIYMFPMNFEEFVLAVEGEVSYQMLLKSPLDELSSISEKWKELLRQY